jgi:hypothetical protein
MSGGTYSIQIQIEADTAPISNLISTLGQVESEAKSIKLSTIILFWRDRF